MKQHLFLIVWPLLGSAACALPPTSASAPSPVADCAPITQRVNILEMEIGDTLKGRITSSGCFFAHYEYAFELARVAKHPGWELELEQTVTSYGKALPGKRTMPLTILDIVDLDWEL